MQKLSKNLVKKFIYEAIKKQNVDVEVKGDSKGKGKGPYNNWSSSSKASTKGGGKAQGLRRTRCHGNHKAADCPHWDSKCHY